MKRRVLVWAVGGLLLMSTTGAMIAVAQQSSGPVFIADDRPVTEDQVRQRLQAEGYSDVQVVRQGRYFQATGTKNGTVSRIAVDAQTGRLRVNDDDDDDDD